MTFFPAYSTICQNNILYWKSKKKNNLNTMKQIVERWKLKENEVKMLKHLFYKV